MRRRPSKSLPIRSYRSPVASAVLMALAGPAAFAQESGGLEEVVVTAQKRAENLQDVPISIEALGNEKLEQMNVQSFEDYVKLLPSVTQQNSGTGAGYSAIYMRGIVTGGDGQATTSQPSVGTYLDEQPITTVQGNLDIHLYDIARVEALAGPQGTLYGASSQAGTIRIITNKPEVGEFKAGYSLDANMVDGDDTGYTVEGFANLPIGDKAAVRLVGWLRKDAGWIDNVSATRTYPGDQSTPADDVTISNAALAEDNYNTIDTVGARAALRVELNDNWTLTPSVQYQKQESEGFWGDDLSDVGTGGKYAVAHFRDEFSNDEWVQAGLTIEGKVGNFDLTYSGNYLDREQDGSFDYSDYSFWYDNAYTSGYFAGLFLNNAGARTPPAHSFEKQDGYTKQSHELRLSSPQENRWRAQVGLFYQKQKHDFIERFGNLPGLADSMLLNRDEPMGVQYPGVVYLNNMEREDTDKAVFGQLAYDLTETLELTVGARFFKPEVTVKGFFGFGLGFGPSSAPTGTEPGAVANGGSGAFSPMGQGWSRNGEWRCPSQAQYNDAPCQNVDKGIRESDNIQRVNLRWKPNDDAMMYLTWSEGYRPGGINRNPFAGDYQSDFLTNYELGWKSEWLDRRLQFNGAVFLQQWDDFQVSFQGANGITQVDNGPSADVKGIELQSTWLPVDNLTLTMSAAFYDSELKDDYDGGTAAGGADKGSPLPITPEFKGSLIARYGFQLGGFDAHVQGALTYAGSAPSEISPLDNAIVGDIPASTLVDLSAGISNDKYSVDLYVMNVTDEDASLYKTVNCAIGICGVQPYGGRARPTTIGIKFSQKF
jgi:outer membrane receptor protein involved in Fe transport